MSDILKIPDSWHKLYSYNCLSEEDFKILQEEIEVGDEFSCDCQECGVFIVGDWRRCECDNRRCYFIREEYNGKRYFEVLVD